MTFRWTDAEVRSALRLSQPSEGAGKMYGRVTTDSRTVEPGDLFVALEGDRFDGHDFLSQAAERGATGAVVSRAEAGLGVELYPVADTLEALGNLARHRGAGLTAKVVGITGSSGKTTIKDLLTETLAGAFRVHATRGNYNNRIGLPLTLLAAPDDTEVLVLEMGTNEPGEIRALTGIALPQVGVVSTVSETHLEKLGSLEGVLDEKLDLLRGLPEDGTAVVGDDPPELAERAGEIVSRLIVAGWSERVGPENRPESPSMSGDGCFRFRWRGEAVDLSLPGRHSVQNALLALAVADVLGVPAPDAARRIGGVTPKAMRSELRSVGGLTLLVDCYNANPQSLRAALELLESIEGPGPRVAVLGSMLELGPGTHSLHKKALEDTLTFPLDLVVVTGLFAEAAEGLGQRHGGPELIVAPDLDEAREILLEALRGSEVVLLKASRGVAMETLIPSLEEHFGSGRAA
ncbi:MAG: UDP-N-acetylmuramoyl-tripeptide--D-alanyl-D-alanine ligase [Gemmatimonadota bacterium]|jgi:UDP-N-acetylmuramoyl-tripeptide--D-alanyl-D-alanine ligase